jgi:VWFA-related protein
MDADQAIAKVKLDSSAFEKEVAARLCVKSDIKAHAPLSASSETMPKRTTFLAVILICTSIVAWSQLASGQTSCLSNDDVKRMLTQVNAARTESLNQELKNTLLKLKEEGDKRFQDAVAETRRDDALTGRMRAFRENNTAQLCPMLKKYGWPGADLVGQDGEAAAFFLLKNSSSIELQRDLLPVLIALTQKGEIDRADLAGYVDRLRVSIGLKQLFGTEATIRDGFLVLYPIEAESEVDARRSEYHLRPLSEYLRSLERIYQMPLVKSPGRPTLKSVSEGSRTKNEGSDLLAPRVNEDVEVVRVETNLVNLDVSVYSEKLRTHVSTLEQKDFKVFEDGHEETITFFAATQVPFDLVLLIDLSGSTHGKRDLIRKTTRRFIEAARPSDRLAIVTFSDTTTVIAPLTEDRTKLLESVKKIEGTGGTKAWDALKFTLDQVLGPRTLARRRALVFMTDGADNHLLGFGEGGSKTSFADLLEAIRRNNTLIIPIYLDTEGKDPSSHVVYEYARKTLAMLAEESGGLYYKARNIGDLNGVYEQVIEDLGKIYSLGYRPANPERDGSWRTVKIQIVNRPDLSPRVRPGYYAN